MGPFSRLHTCLSISNSSDSAMGLPRWLRDKEPACQGKGCSRPGFSPHPRSGSSPGIGMTTHSTILAWKIPWTEKPSGLLSMGSKRVVGYSQWAQKVSDTTEQLCFWQPHTDKVINQKLPWAYSKSIWVVKRFLGFQDFSRAFLVAQLVKNLPAMQET